MQKMRLPLKGFLLFFFLISFVFISKFALAQTGYENSLPNQNWQCLDIKKIGSHTVQLSAKKTNQFPPPGSDVYIVECVSTREGNKCTTGEVPSDNFLFGETTALNFLQARYHYRRVNFSGRQPMQSDANGTIQPVTWESETRPSTGHTFFGVSIMPAMTTGGYSPSLQLGTFYFPNSSESCTSLRWDPFGRVFDSVSLETLPGVSVTLYQKIGVTETAVNLAGITNPQVTSEDGQFNFVVPDGTYTLKPVKATHTFPNVPSVLNPNYYKIYSDIYRGEDIVQFGVMQHRDIPMDPVGAPYRTEVMILDYSVILNKVYEKYQISGEVSHPLAVIKVYNGDRFITQTTATRNGRFDITVKSEEIDPALDIRLEAVRNEFAFTSSFLGKLFPAVFAQSSTASIKLPVILNNIEGYAYNALGVRVPKATITIYLTSSQKPLYQKTADDNGYFQIPSQFLPPLPYIIQIKSPNGTINNLTGSQFAALNKNYTSQGQVNFGSYRPVPNIPSSSVPGVGGQPGSETEAGTTRSTQGGAGQDQIFDQGSSGESGISADSEGSDFTSSDETITNGGETDQTDQMGDIDDDEEGIGSSQEATAKKQQMINLIVLSIVIVGIIGLGIYLYRRKKLQ